MPPYHDTVVTAATVAAPPRPTSAPDMRLVLLVSSLGCILAPLNSTMIAVALPDIRHDFGLSHAAAGWLISGYLIAMCVAQPLGGRLGDQLGRITVFRLGLIAFFVLSLACTFAPNFPLLVTFRVAQAVAGAVLIPNGMAMLRISAPPEQLGALNGLNGSILSATAAAGPLLGAAALAVGSWRLIFPLSVIPVILALALLPLLALPDEDENESRRVAAADASPQPTSASLSKKLPFPLGKGLGVRSRGDTVERPPIDWIGIGLFVALLTGVTLQLSTLREDNDFPIATVRWLTLAAIAVAFIARQRTTRAPAAEWRLFRSRSFAASTAWVLLTNLTMYTTLLMIPFFVRDVQGKSTQLAGLLLGAMSVLVAIVAPLGGRLSDSYGRRSLALIGAAIALAGSIGLLAVLRVDTPWYVLAPCLATLGIGLGLGNGPAITAAIESAPMRMAGAASGTSSMMRYIGSIIGAGILAGVLTDRHDISTFKGIVGDSAAGADINTFRLVALVVVATAALALAAATHIHTRVRHIADPAEDLQIEA